jgi:peptidoglycan/xylan/chitin deacetylase (PgdA/CDA1 family)
MDLSGRRLTLSFDNGPFPDVTPGVLDALRERDLRASFFVCGKDATAPEQRELMERSRSEGHLIGNHTQTHTIELGTTDDPRVAEAEIGRAQEGGGGVIGPNLLSRSALDYIRVGEYSVVLWNSVPRDWEEPDTWPERALEQVASQEWALVVLHDAPTGAMKALPRFLDAALESGVQILQEYPPECVPVLRGAVQRPMNDVVAGLG